LINLPYTLINLPYPVERISKTSKAEDFKFGTRVFSTAEAAHCGALILYLHAMFLSSTVPVEFISHSLVAASAFNRTVPICTVPIVNCTYGYQTPTILYPTSSLLYFLRHHMTKKALLSHYPPSQSVSQPPN